MKTLLTFVLLLLGVQPAIGEDFKALAINAEALSWQRLEERVSFAPVSGNEATAGMYVYRVKFAKGHRNEPHYHTDDRTITVLSGSIRVGYGDQVADADMVELTAGGIYTEPAGQAHYVWARDSDVILQVVGTGPSQRVSVVD